MALLALPANMWHMSLVVGASVCRLFFALFAYYYLLVTTLALLHGLRLSSTAGLMHHMDWSRPDSDR